MIRRDDGRSWHQGPSFEYRLSPKKVVVNVTGSSWTIKGLALAAAVVKILKESTRFPGENVLDFGAGSWLRYAQHIQKRMPGRDLYIVEYSEAFSEVGPAQLKRAMEDDVTFWRPSDFVQNTDVHFDLILLVNVLNTVPEEKHRESMFQTLAKRLNPRGWLVVYQRIWAASENPPGAIEYTDGWLVPQKHHDYFTFRGKTGKRWFNEQAEKARLRNVTTKAKITSSNTLLRVWEKPF